MLNTCVKAGWARPPPSATATTSLFAHAGDSAKAMAVAGLAVVGRQKYGVYPLRGKILNVCDVSAQKIADNEEISNLKKILGLQTGRAYADTTELRYGRVMALTDADAVGQGGQSTSGFNSRRIHSTIHSNPFPFHHLPRTALISRACS